MTAGLDSPLSCIHANMVQASDSTAYIAPSRKGKTLIGGHFDPEIKRQLKTIAAQEDSSIQALLEEAITKLLKDRARSS